MQFFLSYWGLIQILSQYFAVNILDSFFPHVVVVWFHLIKRIKVSQFLCSMSELIIMFIIPWLDVKTSFYCTVPVQPWAAVSACTAAASAAAPGSAVDAVVVAAVSAPPPPPPGCSGTPRCRGYLPWCLPPAGPSWRCFRAQAPWCWRGPGRVEEQGRRSGPDRNTN